MGALTPTDTKRKGALFVSPTRGGGGALGGAKPD